MPISVKAVGNPSMIATTISASMSSPRWPLVRFAQGVKTTTVARITAISDRPNQSSLRILTCAPPHCTTSLSSSRMSSSLTWTISFSLSTSTSSTSSSREGQ